MEQDRRAINEQRAHMDASLDAERTATDSGELRSVLIAQQELDDLVEHDRILADARLLKRRDIADSILARYRFASPLKPGSLLAEERRTADERKKIEREEMDERLQSERIRADLLVETERSKQELNRVQLDACREDTNDQLSSERHDSDAAVAALSYIKEALALSEGQQERYGDVLGIVTHDLRGPLVVLSMGAQAIAEDTQDAAIRKLAQQMTRAAARMDRLIVDLFDVVRIQSGTLRITKQPQGLDALLIEVLKTYDPLFVSRALTFTIEMPPKTIIASFDYDRIVQVLSNLLGNAMKFTPHGGTATLRVEQRAQQVEFSLSNSGPGINPDDLPHLFERFWQLDKHHRRGLGLGLYICKTIVEGHGGTITAETKPGMGATIRFVLPLS